MTLLNDADNKSDKLIQQLAGLRYIFDINRDVLNKNSATTEFLTFKLDIVQSFIEELQTWETLGNQSKCESAIEHAQFFLEQAQSLLDRVLNEQCEEIGLDSQSSLKFSSYTSSNHAYVLSNHVEAYPSCLAA